ncbi:MAG: hypothetical protein U0802_21215 [Candidatus Binatia bacterium]
MSLTTGVAVGVSAVPTQAPPRALSTAWMSTATITDAPLGTPYGQADAGALPSAMLTSMTREPMSSRPVPWQSPTRRSRGRRCVRDNAAKSASSTTK